MQGVTRGLEERINNARSYLSLREINSNLALENSFLKNRIEQLSGKEDIDFVSVKDSLSDSNFNIHLPG